MRIHLGSLAAGLVLGCVAVAHPLDMAGAGLPTAKVYVVSSGVNAAGLYELQVDGDGAGTLSLLSSAVKAGDGGAEIGGVLYAVRHSVYIDAVYVDQWNPEKWEKLSDVPDLVDNDFMAADVALDPASGAVYGCFHNVNKNGFEFGTVDYVARKRVKIAAAAEWSALAADASGVLYAIGMDGMLSRVDKSTGSLTAIGPTGIVPAANGTAAIEPRSGRMFWCTTVAGGKAGLYEVDTTIGAATEIAAFPGNDLMSTLYFPAPAASDGAPAAATSLALDFPQGAMTGKVVFDAPATTFDGKAGSGPLNYRVLVDGDEAKSGSAEWGARVEAQLTVTTIGDHEFEVVMWNSEGDSPAAKASMFVGPGTPASPTATVADNGEGTLTISWEAVTSAVNEGYFDQSGVTYRVVRMPDEKVLVENAALSVTDRYDPRGEFTVYTYEVTAIFGGMSSEPAQTAPSAVGCLTLPYENSFADESALNGFKITGNPAWAPRSGAIYVGMTFDAPLDSWLISPAVYLTAGSEYTLSVDLRSYSDDYEEKAEMFVGNAQTPEAMTQCVLERTTIKSGKYQTYSRSFSVESSGLYYVGLHACSDAFNFNLFADNLKIGREVAVQSPGKVTDFEVTPGAAGAKTATVRFTAPSTDFEGGALDSLEKIVLTRTDGIEKVSEYDEDAPEAEVTTVVVKTFDAPAPGSALEYVDNDVKLGYHAYTAVAYNSVGAGREVADTVYVGINRPTEPLNVTLVETDEEGVVTLSWDVPETDVDGLPVDPAVITYNVYGVDAEYNLEAVAEDIMENHLTFRALPEGVGDLVEYYLAAETESGESSYTKSPMVAVGTPDRLPWKESFANGGLTYPMGFRILTGIARWYVTHESLVYDFNASDGDRGFAYMLSTTPGHSAELFTGKITLKGSEHPVLMFDTYNITWNEPDTNVLEVRVDDGTTIETAASISMELLEQPEWNRVTVDLQKYKDKVVRLSFVGIHGSYYNTLLDNIVIDELSGVESVTANEAEVRAENGCIVITGAEGCDVRVYTAGGALIGALTAGQISRVDVAPGLYIVSVDGVSRKLTVR